MKDATGKINARRFTNNINEFEKLVEIYSIGNLLSVTGEYSQRYGLRISDEHVLDKNELFDLLEPSSIDVKELNIFLKETIANIQNENLRVLLEAIFSDEKIKNKFTECPSSVGQHHSYKHGNLQQV